ncbi:hypothetical protein PTKIN_Ptkin10aG0112900 [Pterospermum kingtungense]
MEDKDSIGIVGNADVLESWVIESLPTVLKHLKLGPEAKLRVQKEILKFLAVEVPLFQTLSDEDELAVKEWQEMETKLYKEERNSGLSCDENKLDALRNLIILLLLQVLLRYGEFCDAASELIICCVSTNCMIFIHYLQVFRYFCGNVTDDGLMHMLRINKKDLIYARHQEAGSEDDDDDNLLGVEEDDCMDEAENAETAESDKQSEDSEATVGGEGADKELPADSDDSDEGMDDDAMFHMDTYLAQFEEKKNQAGGETAQSQLDLFRLRVLSLLEIYLHENQGKCL